MCWFFKRDFQLEGENETNDALKLFLGNTSKKPACNTGTYALATLQGVLEVCMVIQPTRQCIQLLTL